MKILTVFSKARGFLLDVGTLTIGTSAWQLINLACYPLFTRIFSPADFGEFALITSGAAVMAILASGALEGAIITTPSKRIAEDLACWVAARSLLILIAGIGLALLCNFVWSSVSGKSFTGLFITSAALAFLMVVSLSLSELMVATRKFGELSTFRVLQGGLGACVKVLLGVFSSVANGLALGEIFGRLGSTIFIARRLPALAANLGWRYRLRRAFCVGKRFRGFSKAQLPDQLINVIGGAIHVPLIGAAFGNSELGLVSLVFSALYLPVTVLSSPIRDVFRQRASVEYRETGACRKSYVAVIGPVALISLLGFSVVYMIIQPSFVFFFGADWAMAGRYAEIMVPLFFMNFVSMAAGGVLVIVNRLHVSLIWQIYGLVLTVAALAVGILVVNSVEATLWALTVAKVLSYGTHIALSYHFAARPG